MESTKEKNHTQLQWSPSQLELLKQCKDNAQLIEQGASQLAAQACNVAALKSTISSLRNKLSEFDSSLFIVTAIGMLKAGKSTLVNLLARSGLASPTGFGFDTTLRPALITQADNDKGQIQIWFKSDGDKSSVENSLDEVFAVIRGTLDKTTKAHAAAYSLNDENLKNALCKKQQEAKGNMLPKEPLLVVVKVPPAADALLSDKIAILDTPGLDSGISEWSLDKDNCYKWILRRSDLILFLQSSVAPLNETAAAILKEIQKSDRSAPIWLVHNLMEAKHWLRKEELEQECQEQRAIANTIFQKTVGGDFSGFQANLGKACSAILKSEQISETQIQSLLRESCFESLEFSIKASLNSSSGIIRKQNCCNQALESLTDIGITLETLLTELHSKKSALEDQKATICSMLSVFREGKNRKKITDSFPPFSKDKLVIKCQKWRDLENWQRILIDRINAKIKIEETYTADTENQIMKTVADELASGISEMVQAVGEGDIFLNTAGDGKVVADITNKLLSLFEDYVYTIADRGNSNALKKFFEILFPMSFQFLQANPFQSLA